MGGPATSTPPADGSRSEAIPGLLGLRAVMGTWVVADHLIVPIAALFPALGVLTPVLSGGIALETFFILSGFVISHVYGRALATPDRRSYGRLLWARVARLWPTHLFTLLLTAVLVAVVAARGGTLNPSSHYSLGTFLGNVAMLQAIPGVDMWNAPSWSVSTEMAAYLAFPLLAAAVVRAGRGGAVAIALLVVAAQMVLVPALTSGSYAMAVVGLFWARPLLEFVLGSALWSLWRHGLPRHRCWDLVAVAALAGVAAIMYSEPSEPTRVLAVALLGVVVIAVTGAAGPVHRLLELRPVRWAGRTSYSRYLVHFPVLAAVQLCIPAEDVVGASSLARSALVIAWFVAVFTAGGLTHRFVEEPARRRLRALGPRRARETAAPHDDGRPPARRRGGPFARPGRQTPAGTLTPS